MTRHAALYVRISRDKAGSGLGVARQRADCEALAASLGWSVVDVYEDNDVSAYSGKRRPDYERMLADLKSGRVDAVVAWHPDRLHRRPVELEPFIDVIEAADAVVKTCTAGELDLSTPSGRMVARMLGAAARHEVEHAIERMRRKQAQLRASGERRGGPRPFGYEKNLSTVRQSEKAELLDAARRVIAGQSSVAIAREWNARGVCTATGGRWTPASVRRVLTRPRNAGLVEHQGCVVGPGKWPRILDQETYEGVRAVLGDGMTARRAYAPRVRLLLSGIARCGYPVAGGGICGATIVGAGSNKSGRRYRCSTGRHITRLAADLDEHIENIIVDWLPTSEAVEFLTHGNEEGAQLHAQANAIRARLNDLGKALVAGEIDREQMREGTEFGRKELAKLEARIDALSAASALSGLAGYADAAQRWASLPIDRRRAVIDAVLSITLNPSKRGGYGGTKFDPATVTVTKRQTPA